MPIRIGAGYFVGCGRELPIEEADRAHRVVCTAEPDFALELIVALR